MGSPDPGLLIVLRSGRKVYAEKCDRAASEDNSTPDIPLLFIHGFYQSSRTWTPLLPYFPHYTRIAFDVEPHGNTGPVGGSMSTPENAADAKDVLEYFGFDKAILVGHSAASVIAYQFAHDYPGTATKIIVMGPLTLPHAEIWLQVPDIYRGFTFDQLLNMHHSWVCKRKCDDPEVLAVIKSETERNDCRRELLALYLGQVAAYQYTDVKGVETWIMKGTEDSAIPADACEVIRDLTNGRIIEVPTGHFFTWEDVEATARAIRIALGEEPWRRRLQQ